MPKVIIIPYNQLESVCKSAISFANEFQTDFEFELLSQSELLNSPFIYENLEFMDALNYLYELKTQKNYKKDDLILSFYNGILHAHSFGLTNLFLAGSRLDQEPPCIGIISIKYLDLNILEKYDYEIQKHSILHLIVCAIISVYTNIQAHSNVGCLLDFNNDLKSFNLKLQKGYKLCSNHEFGCFDKIKNEKYGKAILRLCENFKNNNKNNQIIIKELIMEKKTEINVGDINNINGQINIGADITISNSAVDINNITNKLDELIKILQNNEDKEKLQPIITNFDNVKEEINKVKPDKMEIFNWLSNTKGLLENAVLANHVRELIHWVYEKLNFIY